MSTKHFIFNKKYGKEYSLCVVCRIHHTEFNDELGRYERFCKVQTMNCETKYREIFLERMTKRPDHILSNPEVQQKMLRERSISGSYTFEHTGEEFYYSSSYELDFLKYFEELGLKSGSLKNCEFVFYYEYEGKKHMYMPDYFMPELNLVIEIKDGGDNPNNHPKIQAVDKPKELLKDEAVRRANTHHFIKIVNKEYRPFDEILEQIRAIPISNDTRSYFISIPETLATV